MIASPNIPLEDLGDRTKYIGASDIAAILNFDKYRDAYRVYQEKVGLVQPEPMTRRQEMGHRLEPVLAAIYSQDTGYEVEKPPPGGIQSPDLPCLIMHPDYLVKTPPGEPTRVMDCKATETKGYGNAGTEDVPGGPYSQALGLCSVTKADFCDLTVYRRVTRGPEIFFVAWDAELWREVLRRLAMFWDCVERRDPPTPHLMDSMSIEFPTHEVAHQSVMTKEDFLMFALWRRASEETSRWEKVKKRAAEYLKKRIGAAEYLGPPPDPEDHRQVPFLSYRAGGPGVSMESFLLAYPEMVDKVEAIRPKFGPRTIRLCKDGKSWMINEGHELLEAYVREHGRPPAIPEDVDPAEPLDPEQYTALRDALYDDNDDEEEIGHGDD